MQGLLPGDLGDVGTATIDKEKLEQLKELLLSEKNLEVFSSMAASMEASSTKQRETLSMKRRKTVTGAEQQRFNPLSTRERKYLELCARVLRCLQRLHVAASELASSKDIAESLIDECTENGGSSRGLGSRKSIEGLSLSPWISSVARATFSSVTQTRESSSMGYASSSPMDVEYASLSQTETESQGPADNEDLLSRLPMFLAIHDLKAIELDDYKVVAHLQIISACAEVFPRGECWSSTNKWFETHDSPLDSTAEESLSNVVTYCNASSVADMAALVYSLSLILGRYGHANGSVQVQFWTLACLLKLTEASHICCRYSADSKNSVTELMLAWRCVWNRLLHSELRYHSSTAHATPSTVGELVIMLLTEIVRGGLTDPWLLCYDGVEDFVQARQSSYVRKNQDKIWSLPVFSTAVELRISAPFELASAVMHRAALVEGELDSICTRSSDSTMQKRVKTEAEQGRGRRFRLANFCLQFMSQAIKSGDKDLIRRIGPFGSAMFCALLDSSTKVTSITSFTIQAFRELKFTDHTYDPTCFYLASRNNPAPSDLGVLWEDSIFPFSSQYQSEMNRSMWNKLNDRDLPNCPFWSSSDRSWLGLKFASLQMQSAAHCPSQIATDLKEYGLNSMLNILGQSSGTNVFSPSSLSCRAAGVKVALTIALCGDASLRKKAPWCYVEQSVHSVVDEAMSNMESLRASADDFAYVFTDVIGIIRLVRFVMSTESCAQYINAVLPVKVATDLYEACERLVRSHPKTSLLGLNPSNDTVSRIKTSRGNQDSDLDSSEDDREEFRMPSQQMEELSRSSGSEIDNFDSEEESFRSKKKRKRRDGARERTPVQDHRPGEIHSSAPDSRSTWICSSIMVHIEPSIETSCIITDAILWPRETSEYGDSFFDPNEPHDFLICLGLLYKFAWFGQNPNSNGSNNDDKKNTMISLCLDVISKCRVISGMSSPMHLWGFGACEILASKKSFQLRREIELILETLHPRGTGALRALKNRPTLRYLQVRAATKCFVGGNDEFHKKFDKTFARNFVMTPLKDQNPQVRRAGIEALGAALVLFPVQVQNKIASDALAAFPPKPSPDEKKPKKTFTEWVDEKGQGQDFIDSKKRAWKENKPVVEADKVRCIGVIGGNTTDDEVAGRMTHSLLHVSETAKWRSLAFRHLESLAKCRQYASVEEMLQDEELRLIGYWFNSETLLSSLPATFTLPSLIRCLSRLGLHGSNIVDERLFETAASEYIFQNASVIVPSIFVANIHEMEDILEDIISNPIQTTFESGNTGSFVGNLVLEAAMACTEGNIRTLIKALFHNIYAHLIPVLTIDGDEGEAANIRQSAEAVLDSISRIVKNVHKQISKSSTLIVVELLSLGMKKTMFSNGVNSPHDVFARGMRHVVEGITNNPDPDEIARRGLFQSTSTSATECILGVKMMMDQANHPNVRLRAWKTMDAIVEVVQSQPSSGSEVGFCIGLLLGICLNTNDDKLRLAVLGRLENIVNGMLERNASESGKLEISLFVNKMVSTLIQIHEEYQLLLVDFFLSSWMTQRIQSRLSTYLNECDDDHGPLQDTVYNVEDNDDDCMKSAVGEFGQRAPTDVIECMALAYGILESILDTSAVFASKVLDSLDPFPESEIAPCTLRALGAFNKKCSLVNLMQKFERTRDKRTDLDFAKKLQIFLSIASRFRAMVNNSLMSRTRVDSTASVRRKSNLPSEVRSLISALKRLSSDIQCHISQAVRADGKTIASLLTALAKELFELCDKKFVKDIQVAATKCIGDLGLFFANVDLSQARLDSAQSGSKSSAKKLGSTSDPLLEIYSSAFALLSEMIQSDDIHTAVSAKDTVKALMVTQEGSRSWKNSVKLDESRRILAPFDCGERIQSKQDLPDAFLKRLLGIVQMTEEEVKLDNSWCWDDNIWVLPGDGITYEDWIQNLVCAILVCCYTDQNENQPTISTPVKGASDFFPACLSICASK